ncbi:NAD(P)-dependent oxidoreductase [uncultured Candidatus Pelagibacter sp.]|jgi:2-hydroxy-3-oxopropionate reductase|uniref:NAD(P)-dependent oxidoreductase n=1 Tax=uncultured Candidatus Pelagibacter sp. TaxID=372654 RepID=UPI0023234049|nr:NAD(P)-dependent oxidoreductase [uncultured Candidatus Pelagibacter sp.]MDA7587765.1 NAD(P)-dependent oxidoreductase [Candidatus Pelagibacter sp.]MDC0466013.1 NAD(P)-dependent oxidoreductase [Candidatus Pelagibacter sp.]MDC1077460.1 NAD(P)-dependent oxidoreductase [Candidatus Pelagibacter sp.]
MKKIGFIGIGLMGFPMAKNILKAGYSLKAFNRSPNKAEQLKEFGAEITTSIDDVVNNSDVVITMLTDDTAINEVMDSPNFLENLKSSATVIDMSSVKPTTATKYGNNLKSKNIKYLDAPVSGGTIGAEEASLAIMVGGEQDVFNEAFDVLKAMGNPTLVGPVGSGQVSKLANQIIVGLTIGAVAEAITLCEKAGANPNKMIKALSGGWADSKILQTHGKRMIDKDFTPKGRTSVHLKDMNNILECANSHNTHLPISNLVKEMYKTLVNNGQGETDHSSLYKEIERINKK